MPVSAAHGSARVTVFARRINELLDKYIGADLFRLEPDTIGIAGHAVMDALLRSRLANDFERPTFKPILGKHISRIEASAMMRAASLDVRAALKKSPTGSEDLSGEWPHVGHAYLRDLVFGRDPLRLRILVARELQISHQLTWAVTGAGAALPGRLERGAPMSNLAALTVAAETYTERRHAMVLYRRMAQAVCLTVSTLVTNALWLASPFPSDVSNGDILLETLRLLPPSWSILRVACPEFPAVDDRIGPKDDVLLLPLLSQRDPAHWTEPDAFRPERWKDLDPENHPGYLPFGHASERCWGRHMVMPLAERLLDILRAGRMAVNPRQTMAKVPLTGLLEVSRVQVTRQ